MSISDTFVRADEEIESTTTSGAPMRKILVAVNRPNSRDGIMGYVASLAIRTGAAVRVVHIREREVYAGHRFSMESADEAARVVDELVSYLEAKGVTATGCVRVAIVGREGAAIVDEAMQWEADTIVLGPGPRRSWRRMFGLGVRGQLLNQSRLPILVAPQPGQEATNPAHVAKRERDRRAA